MGASAEKLDRRSVYVSIAAELITDDPGAKDDRAAAQIGLTVGCDYYPTVTTEVSEFAPATYVPSIGNSRWELVTVAFRYHSMTPIDPPGYTETPPSAYRQSGGLIAISEAEFRSNPPPGP